MRPPVPFLAPLLAVVLAACSASAPAASPMPTPVSAATDAPGGPDVAPAPAGVGVLVMAHGGSDEWNDAVAASVERLRRRAPTAVAWGMADPRSLERGLDSLRDAGVDRVAVVRMFLSGDSFLEQTLWYLGIGATPPRHFVLMDHGAHGSHGEGPTTDPIPHGLRAATHADGILDGDEAGRILAARARERSVAPRTESVLLLAHGVGDEAENDALLARIDGFGDALRTAGFVDVMAATLREDWPEARARSEADLRAWMAAQADAGTRVIVVPVRLSGFGPYADVLAGFEYAATPGLLPHPAIAEWVERSADRVACRAGWGPITGPACPPDARTSVVLQTPPAPDPASTR